MPWPDALHQLGTVAPVGVMPVPFETVPVIDLHLVRVPLEDAARALGAYVGRVAVWTGDAVAFVAPDADTAVDVFDLSGHPADELTLALQTVGLAVQVSVVGDLVVMTGPRSALASARDIMRRLGSGADAWLLRVHVVTVARSYAEDLGLGLTAGGSITVGGRVGSGSMVPPSASGLGAAGLVELIAAAAAEGRHASVETTGTLYLVEGVDATLGSGRSVPVPVRAISPEGTVTTLRYETRETGFRLRARARRLGDRVRLHLVPNLSTITGDVDGVPIVDESSLDVVVVAESGEWVVIGGLHQASAATSASGLPWTLGSRRTRSRADDLVLLLVQPVRVWSSSVDSSRDVAVPPTQTP